MWITFEKPNQQLENTYSPQDGIYIKSNHRPLVKSYKFQISAIQIKFSDHNSISTELKMKR